MTLKTPSPSVFPRKYRQILKHQEYKANTVKQPKKPQSSIRPNEAFKEFAQRIDNECRQLINIEARKSSKTLLKRTTWLKNKRKKKLKEAEPDKFEKVKFGEVAMEPPILTRIPRKIGGSKGTALQDVVAKKDSSEIIKNASGAAVKVSKSSEAVKDLQEKVPKDKFRKQKLKKLSLAERFSILGERTKAINSYRNLVQKRAA